MFDILHRCSLAERMLPDARCPGCEIMTAKLYLVRGAWRCAGCHELTTRAALATPQEKELLQVRQLHREVKGRKPPTRGFRTWDRKRLKLDMRMERLDKQDEVELREHLRAQVAATWIDHPFDAAEEGALIGHGYREPPRPVPSVLPWFG